MGRATGLEGPLRPTGKELWRVILFPFLLSRLIWELVGYFTAGNLQGNPTYEIFSKRGFFLTRIFPVDIFARWDSAHYFSILSKGYEPSSDLATVMSNVAFFPLYPWIVKSFGWFNIQLPDGFYILLGVVLSNLFFLGAAYLIYRLSIEQLGASKEGARRAILLLVAFPASFFFSSFYPESLFLLLSAAAFTLAIKERWMLAGLCCALAVLTRIQGLVLTGALVWLYFEKLNWRWKDLRASVLWVLLPILAFIGHTINLYFKTGSFLAMFESQMAWGRNQTGILAGIWTNINGPNLDVFKIDLALVVFFLVCIIFLLKQARIKALGVYSLLLVAMPLATGSLISVSRFLVIIFPVFLFLGEYLKERDEAFFGLGSVFFTLQIIYFSAWVNYYWIA
jgi:hypothetical protein